MAASLAMDGVGLVPLQSAFRTWKGHLVRPNHSLGEAHEKRYPDNHGHDRGELAEGAGKRDVAKTRCGDRGNGEIEGIHKAFAAVELVEEARVDKAGHDKQEDNEVDDCAYDVDVVNAAAEAQHLLQEGTLPDRPDPHGAQEGEIEQQIRKEQRGEDKEIHPGHRAEDPGFEAFCQHHAGHQFEAYPDRDQVVDDQIGWARPQIRPHDEKGKDSYVDEEEGALQPQRQSVATGLDAIEHTSQLLDLRPAAHRGNSVLHLTAIAHWGKVSSGRVAAILSHAGSTKKFYICWNLSSVVAL